MSTVSDRRARVGAAVDRAFGESFLLSPRCPPEGDPNGRPVSDSERPIFEFTGRWTSMASEQHARSRATALETTRAFVTEAPSVTADRAGLAAEIRKNDVLTRLETGAAYVVERTADGGFGRIVLTLRAGPR
ncbi:hypothetical protein MFUR16E_04710 [Methylobacterium fujisawaense]|uniref:hypothetical protein n=1 Tax=Methylobacterium fujisawaense TaxID=107400 RepID=UPI002F2D9884